jgi:hypothetical protein
LYITEEEFVYHRGRVCISQRKSLYITDFEGKKQTPKTKEKQQQQKTHSFVLFQSKSRFLIFI